MDASVYWGTCAIFTLGVGVLTDEADAAQDRSHRY